ncbi:MAG: hypothetical protein N3D10_01920 [Candidatus Micrarchaeota archaeon]|nr:hypothetical protein [Candidatus Micrarchaeota archaeon]
MKILTIFLLFLAIGFALPVGATVSAGTPVTLGTIPAGTAAAWGGNITRVNLTINSSTLHWQGFYGTITASLRLASGSGSNINTMKVWDVNTLSGQVYVSRSANVDFTALNSTPVSLADVDSAFSFLLNSNDAAANTGTNNANPQFYIGHYIVAANSRPLITTFNNASQPIWKEVVLRHSSTGQPEDFVFVGLINSSGIAYNGEPAHFQLIVPENAAGDSAVSTYYFYGEVQ